MSASMVVKGKEDGKGTGTVQDMVVQAMNKPGMNFFGAEAKFGSESDRTPMSEPKMNQVAARR
ncbi:MAG: hypothetical protein ABIF01_01565 [Candidatus Micrarchaeota archaeon]